MSVSRRGFLKGAAVAAGAVAASTVIPATAEAKVSVPKKWDHEYDVVVIGYGGSGAPAAIAAHDAKAKVLIIEKMKEGGGNLAVSSGGMLQYKDAKAARNYLSALYDVAKSERDDALLDVLIREIPSIMDWVKALKPGTDVRLYGYAGFNQIPGAESIEKWSVRTGKAGGGPNLWEALDYAVNERKIPIMLETPAKRLITDAEGAVIGVLASQKGKDICIKAKRGVVLATGGFEYDEKYLMNSVRAFPIHALGSPGNTGDGLRMASEVGAHLWHMADISAPLGMKIPGYQTYSVFSFNSPGYILVDQDGKRFVNEKNVEHHSGLLAINTYDGYALKYPRIPCYAIFDDRARAEDGPLRGALSSGYLYNKEGFKWSRDNMAEIDKGIIIKGDTIDELAKKIKIDPEILKTTVNRWNTDIKSGSDTLFGRKITNEENASKAAYLDAKHQKMLSVPIEKGPFYAVELYPVVLNTQGGVKRDKNANAVNAFGEAIRRLYSVGENGSICGTLIQGASNVSECIIFGRIAGTNAAKEKPW